MRLAQKCTICKKQIKLGEHFFEDSNETSYCKKCGTLINSYVESKQLLDELINVDIPQDED